MIKRIYIDNYRCFDNFEIELGPLQLIMGGNGSGKSTLMEILGRLRDFISGVPVDRIFSESSRTRWRNDPRQRFQIDVVNEQDRVVSYRLMIEYSGTNRKVSVASEIVVVGGTDALDFRDSKVTLRGAEGAVLHAYPFSADRSALSTIPEQEPELVALKACFSRLLTLRLNPQLMTTRGEYVAELSQSASSFSGWYAYALGRGFEAAQSLHRDLRQILPEFESLNVENRVGSVYLSAHFLRGTKKAEFALEELSDGQKALIVLYSLLHFALGPSTTLFIDEPENYLALSELEPLLYRMIEQSEEAGTQLLIASHHPEFLDRLAPDHGIVLEQRDDGRIESRKYFQSPDNMLRVSEAIARGWTD